MTVLYVDEVMRYNMNMRKMPRGQDHYNWKGGKRSDGRGYIKIYKPDHPFNNRGYVLEHRLKIEEYMGRYLLKDEVVHHIDGNKANNFIGNLKLMIRRDHTSHHLIDNKIMLGVKLSDETKKKISESIKNFWKINYPQIQLNCINCNRVIFRQSYRLKRSKHHFCSFKCYKKYGTGVTVWS